MSKERPSRREIFANATLTVAGSLSFGGSTVAIIERGRRSRTHPKETTDGLNSTEDVALATAILVGGSLAIISEVARRGVSSGKESTQPDPKH